MVLLFSGIGHQRRHTLAENCRFCVVRRLCPTARQGRLPQLFLTLDELLSVKFKAGYVASEMTSEVRGSR